MPTADNKRSCVELFQYYSCSYSNAWGTIQKRLEIWIRLKTGLTKCQQQLTSSGLVNIRQQTSSFVFTFPSRGESSVWAKRTIRRTRPFFSFKNVAVAGVG